MKYLLHDKGIQWFRDTLCATYFKGNLNGLCNEPTSFLTTSAGIARRQECGSWSALHGGRRNGDSKAQADRRDYFIEIRLTANQDLLLCNIGTSQRASIRAQLEASVLRYLKPCALARHGCPPGLPTCGLAITESERILPDVLDRLDAQLRRLEIEKSLLVRMTGCPNGCACPYMAELGWRAMGQPVPALARRHPQPPASGTSHMEKLPLDDLEKPLSHCSSAGKPPAADAASGTTSRSWGSGSERAADGFGITRHSFTLSPGPELIAERAMPPLEGC